MVFSCPWPCVEETSDNPKAPQQQRSFVQVLSPTAIVASAPLPHPKIRGKTYQ